MPFAAAIRYCCSLRWDRNERTCRKPCRSSATLPWQAPTSTASSSAREIPGFIPRIRSPELSRMHLQLGRQPPTSTLLLLDRPDRPRRVESQRAGDMEELDDVDAAF